MKIYLVRHGETEWNSRLLFQGHSDISLNSAGRRQAARICGFLKEDPPEVIVSSDLKRAYETALIIKKGLAHKPSVIKEYSFRERSYGNLEGKQYMEKAGPFEFTGETDFSFFRRVKRVMKRFVSEYAGRYETAAVITHGGVIRGIVRNMLKIPGLNYRHIRLYNASVTELFYDEKKKYFYLTLLNSISHLSKADRAKAEFHIKGV
ncbi:MAG: histidine phosphatase family protein [Candidatus Goldiibacteriota bacterium]